MPIAAFPVESSPQSRTGQAIRRALEVLTRMSDATAILFDRKGQIVAGPVAGNKFIQSIIETDSGTEAIVDLHRAARQDPPTPATTPLGQLLQQLPLSHFNVSVQSRGDCVGWLSVGDRPTSKLSPEQIEQVAELVGLDAARLQKHGAGLRRWVTSDIEDAESLAMLIAELIAQTCEQDEALQRRTKELAAVYDIAGMLAGTTDLRVILGKIADIVCQVMRVKACSIRLLDAATGDLHIRAVHNLSEEYLNKGPVTVDQNPIDSAAIEGEMVRIKDAPSDPRTKYPEQARKEGIVSGLVCGLIYRGKPVGVLRVYTGEPHVFSAYEEALLQAVASQTASAIVNARLLAERLEAERYSRQLEYAGEVQRRMIPASPPHHDHADIGAVYRPTFRVGGDFYDFVELPKGNLGVAMADVSGKGVPASLQMASLRAAFRVNAHFMYDIHRIMVEVNQHLCRDTTPGEFATAFYGVLTPDGRRFTYCNAGHLPPMLLRDGKLQYLETGGMIIGVDPEAKYDNDPLTVQPGDVILIYTDGVVEAMNFSEEQYGKERLAESLMRYAGDPPDLLVKHLLWDLRRFRGLADRLDDVSIVVLKIK